MPTSVLEGPTVVEDTEGLLRDTLIATSVAQPVHVDTSAASFDELAQLGLYVFDWTDVQRTHGFARAYEKVSYPLSPVTLDRLPAALKAQLVITGFDNAAFDEVDYVDVAAYFPCLGATA
ncbi:hypothetical protein [Tahibacter amnicola]|uniref:Uncharacterized protein n=1 Tax=Tahibacter amnicola TaxID=2976241 RepID=A0ABY6BFU9_9GAMM|nr:hypothetical protein [Tahibacter amnicola]UXI68901.1 hypothetical protein N4264_04390 [Tahibacter amnicola]